MGVLIPLGSSCQRMEDQTVDIPVLPRPEEIAHLIPQERVQPTTEQIIDVPMSRL